MMDCNNYSYTGADFWNDGGDVYAEYMNGDGFGTLALEQWGSDTARKVWNVTIWNADWVDLCEAIPADASEGWETLRHSYKQAARLWNEYAPEGEAVALF